MIDIEKAKIAFKDYISHYDIGNERIKLKVRHTYQVQEMSQWIAKDLNLSEEDIKLANLIGLLHDIGRFEQIKRYNSFNDLETVDHAQFSADLLFHDGLIREFIEEDQYDSVIEKAIRNHNKYKIEEGLSEKELLHSKIIRDSDKADNFYVKSYEKFDVLYDRPYIGDEAISDEVYEDFINKQTILSKKRKTNMDAWISVLAFIFDFNFSSGLKWIKDKDYINILVDRIDYQNQITKQRMEMIRKIANQYIDKRIKENG